MVWTYFFGPTTIYRIPKGEYIGSLNHLCLFRGKLWLFIQKNVMKHFHAFWRKHKEGILSGIMLIIPRNNLLLYSASSIQSAMAASMTVYLRVPQYSLSQGIKRYSNSTTSWLLLDHKCFRCREKWHSKGNVSPHMVS